MSGFLGVYRQYGAVFDERLLDGILQRLRFRGPDAQNIFVERATSPPAFPFFPRPCWESSGANSTSSRCSARRTRAPSVSAGSSMVAASWICAARVVGALIRKYGQGH